MKTAKEIVAFVKKQGAGGKVDVDLVDNLLHERAKALRGQPAEKLEGLLAWAVNGVHVAVCALAGAAEVDAQRVDDAIGKVRMGAAVEPPSGLSSPRQSRVDIALARLEEADVTMRRILDVYEALAVDPPGAVNSCAGLSPSG